MLTVQPLSKDDAGSWFRNSLLSEFDLKGPSLEFPRGPQTVAALFLVFLKLILIGGYLLYKIVLSSTVQQNGSAICKSVLFFWIFFPYRSLQSTKKSSLSPTVGSHCCYSVTELCPILCDSMGCMFVTHGLYATHQVCLSPFCSLLKLILIEAVLISYLFYTLYQ